MLFVNIFLLTFLILIYAWDRDEKHHKAFKVDGEEKLPTEDDTKKIEIEMVSGGP